MELDVKLRSAAVTSSVDVQAQQTNTVQGADSILGTSSGVSFRGSVSLSIQGMAENTNDWRLVGVHDGELTGGGVGFLPQVDAIQQLNVRVDHRLSENDTIFARFSRDNASQFNHSGLPGFGAKSSFTSTTNFRARSRNVELSETHIFPPHVLNQLAAGYNRDFNTIYGVGYGASEAGSW